jgi:hypothetical protein
MHDANWWLIGLAFLLGLLLTFALMIRRVKREVPVSSSASSEPSTAKSSTAEETAPAESEPGKSESESQNDDKAGNG